MKPYLPDPASVQGKQLDVKERTQVLVIGAGPAGQAAAIEAACLGAQAILVDENPIAAATMGDDIPLLFGQRASGAVQSRNAMMQALLDNDPGIAAAYEAGVDVRLSTVAWGLYANGPSVGWLPGLIVGLADGEHSWLVQCDRIIVATGRRDMGLAFDGWELQGVMGIAAAHRLAVRYKALDAKRAVILGSTSEALFTALALQAQGVKIEAVIECESRIVGDPESARKLRELGVPMLTGRTIRQAVGGPNGVESVLTGKAFLTDGEPDDAMRFECDTVVLGIAAIPSIELLESASCKIRFNDGLGGFAPELDETRQCSIPGVYAAGDCAGVWPGKSLDASIAAAEGRAAARSALAAAQTPAQARAHVCAEIPEPGYDIAAYRMDWVRSTVLGATGEPHVCRCEEVTAREILEVRPPRYLTWPMQPDTGESHRDVCGILGDKAPHPDHIKRLTRAGMGVCQGRRCREQVQALLALEAGVPLQHIPLATYRPPVRPLPLHLMAQCEEDPAIGAHWDTWFGMPTQYLPPWDITQPYTASGRNSDLEAASE